MAISKNPVLIKKLSSPNDTKTEDKPPRPGQRVDKNQVRSFVSPVLPVLGSVGGRPVVAEVVNDEQQRKLSEHVKRQRNLMLEQRLNPPSPVEESTIKKEENAWYEFDKYDKMNGQGHHQRIMVIVPAWKDSDCFNTICDLYLAAAVPARIHVVVIYQMEHTSDNLTWVNQSKVNMFRFMESRNYPTANIHWLTCSSEEIRGFGTVRRLGWFYANLVECDYIYSIDAHSRFSIGWDSYQVGACEALMERGVKMPCLASLPWAFTPPEDLVSWVGKMEKTEPWHDRLPFFYNRINALSSAWNEVGYRMENKIKTLNPIDAWIKLTKPNEAPGNNPVRGVDAIELKLMGYSTFGLPWYQGQFLADYKVRLAHKQAGEFADIAYPGYRVAGGNYFMVSRLARLAELSTYMRSDDEVMTSLRIFRAGGEIFTPNKDVLYHWYERPGLPRPGWQHDTLMLSYDCIATELRLLGFSFDWRTEVKEIKRRGHHYADGFLEEPEDLVSSSMQGIRSPSISMERYYDKLGLFPTRLLCRLNDMECSGKRAVTDIDYIKDEYVRPFHLFTTIACTSDVTPMLGQKVKVEMLDLNGRVVGEADAVLNANSANQQMIQVVGGFSIKLVMVVFCFPDKPIPRSYQVVFIDGSNKIVLASSQLFTPRMQAYLSGF